MLADNQTHRQTDRQTDRHTHTHIKTCTSKYFATAPVGEVGLNVAFWVMYLDSAYCNQTIFLELVCNRCTIQMFYNDDMMIMMTMMLGNA